MNEAASQLRRHYSGLTYIAMGVETDNPCREIALAEAQAEGWKFEESRGSLALLERLVKGEWDDGDFPMVPLGGTAECAMRELTMVAK